MMEIFREFTFEAAHRLPCVSPGHKCAQVHGHSYRVQVSVTGPIDPQFGWVLDFAEIDRACLDVHADLDHRMLNDIDGLDNPTVENLAAWIWKRLAPKCPLAAITIWETPHSGCVYRGPA
jgi:6-pyruvoyltetrahydropterin/6-carboxytetrahydropterin synthase